MPFPLFHTLMVLFSLEEGESVFVRLQMTELWNKHRGSPGKGHHFIKNRFLFSKCGNSQQREGKSTESPHFRPAESANKMDHHKACVQWWNKKTWKHEVTTFTNNHKAASQQSVLCDRSRKHPGKEAFAAHEQE